MSNGLHPCSISSKESENTLVPQPIPFTHRNSHTVSIVDLGSRERVAEVPGRTRWTIYDDSRELFFVNIASPARIIVIDSRRVRPDLTRPDARADEVIE